MKNYRRKIYSESFGKVGINGLVNYASSRGTSPKKDAELSTRSSTPTNNNHKRIDNTRSTDTRTKSPTPADKKLHSTKGKLKSRKSKNKPDNFDVVEQPSSTYNFENVNYGVDEYDKRRRRKSENHIAEKLRILNKEIQLAELIKSKRSVYSSYTVQPKKLAKAAAAEQIENDRHKRHRSESSRSKSQTGIRGSSLSSRTSSFKN
eukprot:TRINITY_DN11322_c0_g1_i1.p1 TRINITY_DN11322_c0_g1~~TRINITY_DN11322_c0_g1_i1.p1  ORF type:complete len:205 (+),score=25.78 TRINITY_DN11322_c0_g1_i1:64-678(+)